MWWQSLYPISWEAEAGENTKEDREKGRKDEREEGR